MSSRQLYVHRLVVPTSRAWHDELETCLRVSAGASPGEFELFVHRQSGCYRFDRREGAPPRIGRARIDEERAAEDAAVRFLADANRHWRAMKHAPGPLRAEPFPDGLLAHAGSTLIRNRRSSGSGRWLSRWTMYLPTGSSSLPDDPRGRARAIGGDVVVELSARGALLGVRSNLRLWEASRLIDAYPLPTTAGAVDHGHQGQPPAGRQNESSDVEIVYLLEAPHVPQSYATPFYNFRTEVADDHGAGHGITMRPATSYSLLVGIAVIGQTSAPPRLVASLTDAEGEARQVSHGSDWRLTWTIATLDGLAAAEGERRTATSVRLEEPGMYHVELNVEHVASRIQQRTWRQVAYSPGLADARRRGSAIENVT